MSANPNDRLKVHSVYYTVGAKQSVLGAYAMVVSSWVYMGLVHRPGISSKTCDVPEHFHEFQDFGHIKPGSPPETWTGPRIYVPDMNSPGLFTWDELREYISAVKDVDDA